MELLGARVMELDYRTGGSLPYYYVGTERLGGEMVSKSMPKIVRREVEIKTSDFPIECEGIAY